MPNILLTGAGFSRNWGGWLASEAFEFLIGSPEIDETTRTALWQDKNAGHNFEDTLTRLSLEKSNSHTILSKAVEGMFHHMNKAFDHKSLHGRITLNARDFLHNFEMIFTLNQDLLLEQFYFMGANPDTDFAPWAGCKIPGVRLKDQNIAVPNQMALPHVPTDENYTVDDRYQHYIKLHGSSNWISNDGSNMLVIGGNKANYISKHKLLTQHAKTFETYINKPNTKLMVIGYSFSDEHITAVIERAIEAKKLKLFIVDPNGVDVLHPNRDALINAQPARYKKFQPHIFGASRRTLREIFGDDEVERQKLYRFLNS